MVAAHVYKAIDALPVTAHPMTQFTTGVMALQVSPSTSGMLSLLSIISYCETKSHFLAIRCIFLELDASGVSINFPLCSGCCL